MGEFAFKQLNVDEEIRKRVQKNPELKNELEKANAEYQFIKFLIGLRKELGITQVELAEKSGLTQQVISKIETYKRLPTLSTLLKYVDSMGLKLTVEKK